MSDLSYPVLSSSTYRGQSLGRREDSGGRGRRGWQPSGQHQTAHAASFFNPGRRNRGVAAVRMDLHDGGAYWSDSESECSMDSSELQDLDCPMEHDSNRSSSPRPLSRSQSFRRSMSPYQFRNSSPPYRVRYRSRSPPRCCNNYATSPPGGGGRSPQLATFGYRLRSPRVTCTATGRPPVVFTSPPASPDTTSTTGVCTRSPSEWWRYTPSADNTGTRLHHCGTCTCRGYRSPTPVGVIRPIPRSPTGPSPTWSNCGYPGGSRPHSGSCDLEQYKLYSEDESPLNLCYADL